MNQEGVVRRAAQMWALVAEMWAERTSVEGILSENELRKSSGDSPAYSEADFATYAETLHSIARRLREV